MKAWTPQPGRLAYFNGRYSSILRAGFVVRVKAEASGGRFVVEAIGKRGAPVLLTVKRTSLSAPPPSLFENFSSD